MSEIAPRLVIVASTSGSVMNELMKNAFFRNRIHSVVSDRDCPAIDKARTHGVKVKVIYEKNKRQFSDKLLNYLVSTQPDYVISFFTKLFVGDILQAYKDRIVNLHPSLLPAFKGLDGFGDAIAYGTRYVGSTIHFIDEQMDEGKIIAQTVCPVDLNQDVRLVRHRVFEQQCKSLLQVTKWFSEEKITIIGGKVTVKDARYDDFEYSPNLDFDEAIRLKIPLPGNLHAGP